MYMKTKEEESDKLASLKMLMKTNKLCMFCEDVYEKKGSCLKCRRGRMEKLSIRKGTGKNGGFDIPREGNLRPKLAADRAEVYIRSA